MIVVEADDATLRDGDLRGVTREALLRDRAGWMQHHQGAPYGQDEKSQMVTLGDTFTTSATVNSWSVAAMPETVAQTFRGPHLLIGDHPVVQVRRPILTLEVARPHLRKRECHGVGARAK